MTKPPTLDARLLDALQRASSLELFQLSAVLDRLLADPRRVLEIRKLLHLGQTVHFLDPDRGEIRRGTVMALNDRKLVLNELDRSQQWSLPYTAVVPPSDVPLPETPPEPGPPKPTKADFQRGDRVSFEDRYLQTQVGVIVRINQKTASIDTGDGMVWRVSFSLLRHVLDV